MIEADRLISDAMHARGYPVENFDQRADDLSVHHPEVVQHYRAGRELVLVGRMGRDPSHDLCLNLWIVGNNLRKGAATNAVQVAELLNVRELLRVPHAA